MYEKEHLIYIKMVTLLKHFLLSNIFLLKWLGNKGSAVTKVWGFTEETFLYPVNHLS